MGALSRIEEGVKTLQATRQDHERRLRGLEQRSWVVAGGAAVVGTLLAKFGIHLPGIINGG